ncbi:uncharacterized protein LOC113658020 isoform X2 [Tachysurus fulvidraco]|uniref:uncharacterized protein LOC113658020 isoform X2 n=1 Tax=Tachysurus fulvidraco TaxID=1234273 RepID=UPI000F4D80D8|nr:uncharacterized protein LOC113658020 isoform X2 [Tachysurus fulvidraco]
MQETPDTSHASQGTTPRGLQQSIEGLYLSVRQWKQTLYRQNDSSKFRHRLRRKLAEDKKHLLQEIQQYNANISIKKQLHDQVMLAMRLQEEKSILVLEMAQHCTWLQSLAVVLKNKMAEEDVDKGNEGLCCLLRRRLSEVSEQLQVVLQQYKIALGPEASVLLHVEAEDPSGLSSPDTSEDEEENTV